MVLGLGQLSWKSSAIFLEFPRTVLDTSDKSKRAGTWFPGAVLYIAECCLLPGPLPNKTDESRAIIWSNEGSDDDPVNYMPIKELHDQVMHAAFALLSSLFPLYLTETMIGHWVD